MEHVVSFSSRSEALEALDNGGRFYNFLTRADDGEITAAELGKATGAVVDRHWMFLYFEMMLAHLNAEERQAVVDALSPSLREDYFRNAPAKWSAGQAWNQSYPSCSAIITGVPVPVDPDGPSPGCIRVEVPSSQPGMSRTRIDPITEQFDAYEVQDEQTGENFLVARHHGPATLANTPMHMGGFIEELDTTRREGSPYSLFHRTLFYTYAS